MTWSRERPRGRAGTSGRRSVGASDDDRPEPDAREHEDVVRLADLVAASVERDGRRTGDPVATSARPPVQRRTSAGVASAADVGFDSGSTIGVGRPPRPSPG